jgi:hypothetical protein
MSKTIEDLMELTGIQDEKEVSTYLWWAYKTVLEEGYGGNRKSLNTHVVDYYRRSNITLPLHEEPEEPENASVDDDKKDDVVPYPVSHFADTDGWCDYHKGLMVHEGTNCDGEPEIRAQFGYQTEKTKKHIVKQVGCIKQHLKEYGFIPDLTRYYKEVVEDKNVMVNPPGLTKVRASNLISTACHEEGLSKITVPVKTHPPIEGWTGDVLYNDLSKKNYSTQYTVFKEDKDNPDVHEAIWRFVLDSERYPDLDDNEDYRKFLFKYDLQRNSRNNPSWVQLAGGDQQSSVLSLPKFKSQPRVKVEKQKRNTKSKSKRVSSGNKKKQHSLDL